MLKLVRKLGTIGGFVCPSCAFRNRFEKKISFQFLDKRYLHRHQTITKEDPRPPASIIEPVPENVLTSLEYRKRCVKKIRRAIKHEKFVEDAEMKKKFFYMRQGVDPSVLDNEGKNKAEKASVATSKIMREVARFPSWYVAGLKSEEQIDAPVFHLENGNRAILLFTDKEHHSNFWKMMQESLEEESLTFLKKKNFHRVFQIGADEAIDSFLPSMYQSNKEMSHFVIDAGTSHAYEVQKNQIPFIKDIREGLKLETLLQARDFQNEELRNSNFIVMMKNNRLMTLAVDRGEERIEYIFAFTSFDAAIKYVLSRKDNGAIKFRFVKLSDLELLSRNSFKGVTGGIIFNYRGIVAIDSTNAIATYVPSPIETTLDEADLTRLQDLENYLKGIKTVLESEQDIIVEAHNMDEPVYKMPEEKKEEAKPAEQNETEAIYEEEIVTEKFTVDDAKEMYDESFNEMQARNEEEEEVENSAENSMNGEEEESLNGGEEHEELDENNPDWSLREGESESENWSSDQMPEWAKQQDMKQNNQRNFQGGNNRNFTNKGFKGGRNQNFGNWKSQKQFNRDSRPNDQSRDQRDWRNPQNREFRSNRDQSTDQRDWRGQQNKDFRQNRDQNRDQRVDWKNQQQNKDQSTEQKDWKSQPNFKNQSRDQRDQSKNFNQNKDQNRNWKTNQNNNNWQEKKERPEYRSEQRSEQRSDSFGGKRNFQNQNRSWSQQRPFKN